MILTGERGKWSDLSIVLSHRTENPVTGVFPLSILTESLIAGHIKMTEVEPKTTLGTKSTLGLSEIMEKSNSDYSVYVSLKYFN